MLKVSVIGLLSLFCLFLQVNGLHFYLKTGEARCFFEELPRDTLVVGKIQALEYDENSKDYFKSHNLRLEVTVDETFDNDDRVVNQKAFASGDFTFTSLDSGEHKFCLKPIYLDGTTNKNHRIFFDIAIGSAHDYVDSKSTNQVEALTLKVKSLTKKLEEINFEQELIREREAFFRNQSELTNSRVIRWTIIQLIVLVGTCVYQLRHLKSFFVKQKVV